MIGDELGGNVSGDAVGKFVTGATVTIGAIDSKDVVGVVVSLYGETDGKGVTGVTVTIGAKVAKYVVGTALGVVVSSGSMVD